MTAICTCQSPDVATNEAGAKYCKTCRCWWMPEHGSKPERYVSPFYRIPDPGLAYAYQQAIVRTADWIMAGRPA